MNFIAAEFAAHRHLGQFRKCGKIPYITHPAEVVQILRAAGINDKATLAAAWCHDLIEDTGADRALIAEYVGDEVADLVVELTNDPNARPKHAAQLARDLSPKAAQIRIADKLANMRSAAKNPPPHWSAERRLRLMTEGLEVVRKHAQHAPALATQYLYEFAKHTENL